METITIVGAGVAGLTAAITLAEAGAPVVLFDAREAPGGRARSLDGPYRANLGPHVLYKDGRCSAGCGARPAAAVRGRPAHRAAPALGRRAAPHAAARADPAMLSCAAAARPWTRASAPGPPATPTRTPPALLSAAAGVFAFHHDPGRAVGRVRVGAHGPHAAHPAASARYARGGWGRWSTRSTPASRALGVKRRYGERVGELPGGITIVATEPQDARRLLGDDTLHWSAATPSASTSRCEHRRGDPFVVSDLDECGWVERFTAPDPSLAPAGRGARPGADAGPAGRDPRRSRGPRSTRLLDLALPDRERAHDVAPPARDGRPDRRARPARARRGATGPRSPAATASSSPATGPPRPAC